jgi:ribosomal-protein-alanine N-acetyltransferase
VSVARPPPWGPVSLRTARLILRPFGEGDVEDCLRYRDDPELARYLPHIPVPFTRADAEAFVRTNMKEPWATLPTFAVVLDASVIGTVNLEIVPAERSAMIGFAIGRAHWGRGLAVEAAREVIRWALDAHDVQRVWASTDSRNLRSRRVMEKLGMRLEATLPAKSRGRSGEPVDEVVYALRRDSKSAG